MNDHPQLLFVFTGPGPPQVRPDLARWLKQAGLLGLHCVVGTRDDPTAWRGWVFEKGQWLATCSAATPKVCLRILREALREGEVGVVLPRGAMLEESP